MAGPSAFASIPCAVQNATPKKPAGRDWSTDGQKGCTKRSKVCYRDSWHTSILPGAEPLASRFNSAISLRDGQVVRSEVIDVVALHGKQLDQTSLVVPR